MAGATKARGIESSQAPAMENAVEINVPVKHTGHLVVTHLNMQMPAKHAQALRDVFDGLHERHAKLDDGRHIDNHRMALLWILENIASKVC